MLLPWASRPLTRATKKPKGRNPWAYILKIESTISILVRADHVIIQNLAVVPLAQITMRQGINPSRYRAMRTTSRRKIIACGTSNYHPPLRQSAWKRVLLGFEQFVEAR
jgi:hypothetical protein